MSTRQNTPFDPNTWIDSWLMVGGIVMNVASCSLFFNLDGNQHAQRSLLSRLDHGNGERRAMVRDAALRRMAGA